MEKLARYLARGPIGRWAIETEVDLSPLRARPGLRIYTGIAMIVLSFIVGIPGVVVCGLLATKYQDPRILVLGGSAAMLLNYLLFATGIYLAGGNYAAVLLRWALRKFITRYGP